MTALHTLPQGSAPKLESTDETAQSHSKARFFGIYLVVVGLSHLVFPRRWEPLTKLAFLENVRAWTLRVGVSEATLGALLIGRATRPWAYAGLAVHTTFLLRRGIAVLKSRRT
ncbi:Uncharacterised protein [Mycobacteroides abscessus subsp. bolletii]|nr:Uncharacterised protein [Mycobacteroides abscessus subsp. bolletii]SLF40842.1 Uncharacterised protein [Mycobacteroides abscessus subsp. bolletii]